MLLENFLNKNNKTPIWLMRQAGRYLPEYRDVRKKCGSFLELCYSPKDAAKVTLQPIERFDFDAAIIFSDILVVPHSLGIDLSFVEGEGPKLSTIRNDQQLKNLLISKNNWQFEKVSEAIQIVRADLPKQKPLIGFAGAPWTIITYIIEGKGKTNFENCKHILDTDFKFVQNLVDLVTEQTINYLLKQIDSGIDLIQIFDSWAGALNNTNYEETLIIEPVKRIVSEIKNIHPKIDIICFPKSINYLDKFISEVKPDGISIGSDISMQEAKNLKKNLVVQGNLDPLILLDQQKMIDATNDIMSNLSGENFIFNLGHGILPSTPIENVELLIKTVREYE